MRARAIDLCLCAPCAPCARRTPRAARPARAARAALSCVPSLLCVALGVALPSLGHAQPGVARLGPRSADVAPDTPGPDDTGTGAGDLARVDAPAATPAIGAVLSAAFVAAGLDRDPGRGWIRRARLAGLVPWVTVRTTRDTSWQDEQSEVGHGTTLELRATWRLDRLLFDSHELQVSAIESARRRERRRLATRVIRAYFTWRRAVAAAAGAGDDRVVIRVAEATAELDALTDGWFSDELARPSRGAAGARTARAPAP